MNALDLIMAEFEESQSAKEPSDSEISIEDVRPYFSALTCNLRVLGSQLRLEPYELDDLWSQKPSDIRQRLLEECFKKEKITSWQQFVDVLEKPSVSQQAIAEKIKERYLHESPTPGNLHSSSVEIYNTGSK